MTPSAGTEYLFRTYNSGVQTVSAATMSGHLAITLGGVPYTACPLTNEKLSTVADGSLTYSGSLISIDYTATASNLIHPLLITTSSIYTLTLYYYVRTTGLVSGAKLFVVNICYGADTLTASAVTSLTLVKTPGIVHTTS